MAPERTENFEARHSRSDHNAGRMCSKRHTGGRNVQFGPTTTTLEKHRFEHQLVTAFTLLDAEGAAGGGSDGATTDFVTKLGFTRSTAAYGGLEQLLACGTASGAPP